MHLCLKVAPIVCSALIHSTLLSSWLLEQVWNIKIKNTQPLYIFNRENPQNSEPQNGLRRGLDFIALHFWAYLVWRSIWNLAVARKYSGYPNNWPCTFIIFFKKNSSLCVLFRANVFELKISCTVFLTYILCCTLIRNSRLFRRL